jgi:hypothetical protein
MTLEQVRMYLASETVTPEQADHYIAVITQIERERILKLFNTDEAFDAVYYGIDLGADHVLSGLGALIKGEK